MGGWVIQFSLNRVICDSNLKMSIIHDEGGVYIQIVYEKIERMVV